MRGRKQAAQVRLQGRSAGSRAPALGQLRCLPGFAAAAAVLYYDDALYYVLVCCTMMAVMIA